MTAEFRFQRKSTLGEGGMGEVFLAVDRETGQDAAIKILKDDVEREIILRFERECDVLSNLSHPAIVPVLAHGTLPAGQYYYAMPYVEGIKSLSVWLREFYRTHHGPAEREFVLALLSDVTDALDYIHGRGIYHRDLKPSNILVKPDGRALLIDFGLAGLITSALTRTGVVLGTMTYLAPEQADGREYTARADLYQLGLVLYEMATGTRAVSDPLEYVRLLSQGRRSFPPPSQREPAVGAGLDEVIVKATEVDPARRFESGAQLLATLRSLAPARWATTDDPGGAPTAAGITAAEATAPAGPPVAAADRSPARPAAPAPPVPPVAPRATGRAPAGGRVPTRKSPAVASSPPESRASWATGLVVILALLGLAGGGAWLVLRPASLARPVELTLGFKKAQLTIEAGRPCVARVACRSQSGKSATVSSGARASTHRLVLDTVEPGTSYGYDLFLDEGARPVANGTFIGSEPPALKEVQARQDGDDLVVELELTGPAAGDVAVGQRTQPEQRASLGAPQARHSIRLAGYRPTGPVFVEVLARSPLGEELPLPRRTITPRAQ